MTSSVRSQHSPPSGTAKRLLLSVGVHAVDGAKPHGDSGLTVGELATVHEFGAGDIPARSFIRGYFDENQGRLVDLVKRAVKQSKGNLAQASNMLGERIRGEIQERIANRIDPALKQATIDRKGSDVPLINQGILRNSIKAEATFTE